MSHANRQSGQRPRELRRRVVVPARMRSGSGWTDVCILNVSSRGLLVHSSRTGPQGSEVELWRGDRAIVARVVWRDGARVGLSSEERLPIEDILSLGRSAALQLTAVDPRENRRRRPRGRRDARLIGQLFEFAGVVAIAIALSTTAHGMVRHALAQPMALISAALGG